jgi:hypothetical protein
MLLPSPSVLVLAALAAVGSRALLVQVKDFGANPTKISVVIRDPQTNLSCYIISALLPPVTS